MTKRIKEKALELPKIQGVAVSAPSVEYTEDCCKMYQGTATNKLKTVSVTNNKPTIEDYSGNAVIETDGLKILLEKYTTKKTGLRISTQKLIDYGIVKLTEVNNYKEKTVEKLTTGVCFPLKEYAKALGYDVTEKITETADEKKKEKKRIDRILEKVRNRVNEDLEVLYSMSLSWKEPKGGTKGKSQDYADVRLLQAKSIQRGVVYIQFTEMMTSYLANAYVMQYPKSLFKLDERNPVAYQIGYKLALHNCIFNNVKKNTQGIIKVETLLNASGEIKTIESINETDPGHWDRRIKEPLEKALDYLKQKNILEYWEYSNSKGVALTDEQAEIKNYDDFIKLYIHFDLKNKKK